MLLLAVRELRVSLAVRLLLLALVLLARVLLALLLLALLWFALLLFSPRWTVASTTASRSLSGTTTLALGEVSCGDIGGTDASAMASRTAAAGAREPPQRQRQPECVRASATTAAATAGSGGRRDCESA